MAKYRAIPQGFMTVGEAAKKNNYGKIQGNSARIYDSWRGG